MLQSVAIDGADHFGRDEPNERRWTAAVLYRFEIVLFLLLAMTLAAVVFQDRLLSRAIIIEPAKAARYAPQFFGDEAHDGRSTISVDPVQPMRWRCILRPAYAFPYCSYMLQLDAGTRGKGLDLTRFESVTLDIVYRGPTDTFRLSLKNFDPRYSKLGVQDTLKYNKAEIRTVPGRNVVTLKLSEFGVADWWLTQFQIPPALGKPQFDNVTQVEFQTGSNAIPGTYTFHVNRVTLHGRLIGEAAWYASILGVWAVMIGLYLLYRIVTLRRDLEQRRESQAAALRLARYAEESARRDHLTALLNRTGITDLYHSLAMRRHDEGSFAAILIDVDHFKCVNDGFGHAVGDQVLAGIAAILTANMRSSDIVGRWGGEEFLLICSVSDQEAALAVADKLREAIAACEFPVVGRVTGSFGVYCDSGRMDTLDQVASRADAALYVAKERGRNRAVMYGPSMRAAA